MRSFVKEPVDNVISVPQPPIVQTYGEHHRQAYQVPQPPIVQTSFQRFQKQVFVPQPPIIQNQTRVIENIVPKPVWMGVSHVEPMPAQYMNVAPYV